MRLGIRHPADLAEQAPAASRRAPGQFSTHEPVHARTPFAAGHYDRWLELFVSTVDEHFVGDNAERAKQRATKMADALRKLLNGEYGAASTPVEPTFATSPGDRVYGDANG